MDDPWTLALRRSFSGEPHPPYDLSGLEHAGQGAGESAAVLIVFPSMLDVVAVPVTLTRDLIVLQ